MIRKAEPKDIRKLESFLVEANLDAEGLEEYIDYYSLLETKSGELRACIGIEPVNGVGLVRSFVVSPTTTRVQLLMLFDRVISIAQNKQLSAIYLVTNKETAVDFFRGIGFDVVDQEPTELEESTHYKKVTHVDNSITMEMKVGNVDN